MRYNQTEIDNIATDIAVMRGSQERRDAIKKLIADLQAEPANIFSSNALLSDELNRLREGRTHRAIQKCHQWITYCLSIGWKKEDADGLEVIWWLHRNENGNLKAV